MSGKERGREEEFIKHDRHLSINNNTVIQCHTLLLS